MSDPVRKYHCVTQLQADSWEYRIKGPNDEPNCDDLIAWDDALEMRQAIRAEHYEWDKIRVKEVAEIRALYSELISAVGHTYPGESRHQTARRYIMERETRSSESCAAASSIKAKQVQP